MREQDKRKKNKKRKRKREDLHCCARSIRETEKRVTKEKGKKENRRQRGRRGEKKL